MNNFPFFKQQDSMMCGIACLQMICKFHGKNYEKRFLSDLCHATAEGVSLLGIRDAATQIGFYTISGRLTIEDLSSSTLPCILHWNQNHFVVLYKIKNGRKFYIADPGKGLITYSLEEFKSHWIETTSKGEEKGISMFLEPTPQFYKQKEGLEKDNERSFAFLLGYIRQYRK